jgi:site-specific DNA recombinase
VQCHEGQPARSSRTSVAGEILKETARNRAEAFVISGRNKANFDLPSDIDSRYCVGMDATNKFFIYARKSTDDPKRQLRSIEDQIAENRELAKRLNLKIVEIFREEQTAKTPGRPVFNEMLERIKKGEANGILAWHPDRLARNSLDGGQIIWLVDIAKIVALKFPSYQFEPTPQGKLALALEFGISKYYVDKLSADITRGQRQKVLNGIWPMVSPLGYRNDGKNKGIAPDANRGPLVRKAFELYATGEYTFDQITETVNGLGLTNRRGKRR